MSEMRQQKSSLTGMPTGGEAATITAPNQNPAVRDAVATSVKIAVAGVITAE